LALPYVLGVRVLTRKQPSWGCRLRCGTAIPAGRVSWARPLSVIAHRAPYAAWLAERDDHAGGYRIGRYCVEVGDDGSLSAAGDSP
jgi:hypothetical protein